MAPRNYARAVQDAGAVALILPPDDAAAEDPARLLDRSTCLILAGGADVDPASYGARPHEQTKGYVARARPLRARADPRRARARHAGARHLPRDADAQRGLRRHYRPAPARLPGARGPPPHAGHVRRPRRAPRARLAGGAGGGRRPVSVKSHHHQGVAELGEGLVVTGWSEPDQVIEAVELPARAFALGVLWHPEEDLRATVVRRWWRRREGHPSPGPGGRHRDLGSRAGHRRGDGGGAARRSRRGGRRSGAGQGGLSGLARASTPARALGAAAAAGRRRRGAARRTWPCSRRATPASRSATRAGRWAMVVETFRYYAGAPERLLGDTIPGGGRDRHDLPRAARRGGADRALELPADDRRVEARPGAGGGQHGGAQARRAARR